MSAFERRHEIILLLNVKRYVTMDLLARKFNVTVRTIRNDINVLTVSYPIYTVRGNGGGVGLEDGYHLNENIFTEEQTTVLIDLTELADEHQKQVLNEMLEAYSNVNHLKNHKKSKECLHCT